MKIIKPIALPENEIETNAPADDAIQWEAIGRDFAEEFGEVLVTANASKVYALDLSAGQFEGAIKVQDVDTGNTEVLQLNSVSIIPTSILVSPDDAYLAMAGSTGSTGLSTYEMHIYSLATGNRVYRRQNIRIDCEFYQKPYSFAWSPDSSKLAFWAMTVSNPSDGDLRPKVFIVSEPSWAEVVSDSTPIDYRPDDYNSAADYFGLAFDLVFDDTGSNVFAFGQTQRTYFPTYTVLIKVNASTGADTGRVVQRYDSGLVEYNSYRSEVIVVNYNEAHTYLASDLSDAPDQPDFSGLTRYGTSLIKALNGKDLLYVQDDSSDERHTTFKLSDYSLVGVLDPATEIRLLDETSAYYVTNTYPRDGFRLIDKTTFAEEGLQNPSVSAGAVYQYQSRLYEVLTDNQERPDIGALASPPTWLDLGAINSLRLIDGKIGTFTEGESTLTVTINSPQLIDGLGLFNMLASAFRIELVDATDSVVFDSGEITLSDLSGIQDWYTYFYDPESYQTDSVFTALPPYKEASIRITLSAIDGVTRIGELVAGRVRTIGDTEFGVDVGILDFSRKERDEFGNLVITERQFSKRADYPVSIRSNRIAAIQQLLAGLRATPTVFIGAESQPETVVYGFYRGFNLVLRGPVFSECSIEVEGLT